MAAFPGAAFSCNCKRFAEGNGTCMRNHARLSVTLRLILYTLFPAVTRDRSPAIPAIPDSARTVSPEELLLCLRNPGRIAGFTGGGTLLVTGAFPLAAPFILFRLKRWGFSGCRVSVEQEGLRIDMRR